MMCRMDKLPALEVVADEVEWDYDMGAAISGDNTLVVGFSHVSIRTAHLLIKCEWQFGENSAPFRGPKADEVLVSIVQHAPPTLRTCRLGFASVIDDGDHTWKLELRAGYVFRSQSITGITTPMITARQTRTRVFTKVPERLPCACSHLQWRRPSRCRWTDRVRRCS